MTELRVYDGQEDAGCRCGAVCRNGARIAGSPVALAGLEPIVASLLSAMADLRSTAAGFRHIIENPDSAIAVLLSAIAGFNLAAADP